MKTKILTLIVSIFIAALFGSSVSASSGTLIVSIPDNISLNILPTGSGSFASTSATVSVKTTYAAGYTLGIKASNNNSNALINDNDSSKTIPSITSNVSEATFSSSSAYNNKWGFKPSKLNSAANSDYLPAPSSDSVVTVLDQTATSNPSSFNDYTLTMGVRTDSTLTPGSYRNVFVLTAVANPTPYDINYLENTTDTVTNMPSDTSSSTYDASVNISSTVPARDGYNFKGWCTAQVADDATCSGTTYNPNGGGTDLTWTIDQTAASNSLTLYAMWESDVIIMQTMSESDCITSQPTSVVDIRDNETYLVQRLADGNCWLLDNLRLDPTAVSLTDLQGNTNASNQTLTYFKNGGGSSPYTNVGVNTTWASTSDNKYDEPKVVTTYKDTTTTSYGAGSSKIGVYYNYCAASAGSYCYSSDSGTGNATEDLCPAGWRMPTGGASGEYQALYTAYSSDVTNFKNALSTPLSGIFGGGSANGQGTYGFFWSSTRGGDDFMYGLYVTSSTVDPTNGSNRNLGDSVRCVKKTPYMQDVTDMDLEEMIPDPGDTVTLADKRDNTKYLVGRLADGNVWMLDNLALDPTSVSLATLQGNTNASNQTLTYLKNGGGSSPYPANGVNTTWASSSDNKHNEPKVVTTYKDTTTTSYGAGSGKIGVYYNYCAASAGSYCYASSSSTGNATEDLCPAGWRMPTGGSSGEYEALYTAYNSDVAAFEQALSTPLSGYFVGGSAYGQGTYYGYFWSSTRRNNGSMYNLYVDSSSVDPASNSSRVFGVSMRCLLDS
ncbi:hypothetical protein IKF92_00795 [Candidatus Saccharibacteria bacterium]|nr:hypothetical protein [Candidatus Saccharibacteria bacterium]